MRHWLIALAASLMLVACGGSEPVVPPAELTEFEPALEPQRLWSAGVSGGTDEQFLRLRPVLADDRLYTASRDGTVVAIDAETGSREWRTDTGAPISGGVGRAGDFVLIGTSDARVIALRADDGERAWETDAPSEVLAPPQGSGGLVIARTVDGYVQALDVSSGEPRWRYQGNVPVLTLRGVSTPLVTPRRVIAGFDDGALVALAPDDGRELWSATVAVPSGGSELERMVDIDGDPVRRGGEVYAAAFQGRVASIEINTGQILWTRDLSSHAGLGVDGEAVYVADERDHVWALDRGSGGSLWKQDALQGRKLTAPAPIDGAVVVGDFEGYVHWLSTDDGRLLARRQVGDEPILATPVVDGERVYVLNQDGDLAAFNMAPVPEDEDDSWEDWP